MKKYEEQAFYQYLSSTHSELSEVYKNPSKRKRDIYEHILHGMHLVAGTAFRILSHNAFIFTCAYLYKKDGKVYLAVFCPSKAFDVDVTDTVLGVLG